MSDHTRASLEQQQREANTVFAARQMMTLEDLRLEEKDDTDEATA